MNKFIRDLNITGKEISPRTRDSEDISVMQSLAYGGVIYLQEKCESPKIKPLDNELGVWNPEMIYAYRESTQDDDVRRVNQFNKLIRRATVLDFGCGSGGFLAEIGDRAFARVGYDINKGMLAAARGMGQSITYVGALDSLEPGQFDLITMFHVLEHLDDPVQVIRDVLPLLNDHGTLLIEVPCAHDALIGLYNCEGYRNQSWWSEHKVLHTPASLDKLLSMVGGVTYKIEPFQRYNLGNHIKWLCTGEGGGLRAWDFVETPEIRSLYAKKMCDLGFNDTLIAYVNKSREE